MNTKPKLSPPAANAPTDDELDEFSISAVLDDEIYGDELGDDDDTVNALEPLPETGVPNREAAALATEPTIDELLDSSAPVDRIDAETERQRRESEYADTAETGSFETLEDLLSPDVLFPKTADE